MLLHQHEAEKGVGGTERHVEALSRAGTLSQKGHDFLISLVHWKMFGKNIYIAQLYRINEDIRPKRRYRHGQVILPHDKALMTLPKSSRGLQHLLTVLSRPCVNIL